MTNIVLRSVTVTDCPAAGVEFFAASLNSGDTSFNFQFFTVLLEGVKVILMYSLRVKCF
jgi:hypothetical protein